MINKDIHSVTLKLIALNNWKKAISLNVSEDQKEFVASNVHSIAESQFYDTAYSYGIFKEEEMK